VNLFKVGVLLIAVLSTAVVAFISCAKRPSGKFWYLLAALIVPMALANGLYWSAVWLTTDPSAIGDYKAWEFVFLIPWFIAGAIPSFAVVLVIRRARSNMSRSSRTE